MFWQFSLHLPHLLGWPSVFVWRILPPSLSACVGPEAFIPSPDIGKAGLIQGWLIRALHSIGPRDIFGDGLWPHQNQGNLWPQVRTLPTGWGWSWIYEDVGAGMASLIFWLHGVRNRPTKWGIGGGEKPATDIVGWIHLYLRLALFLDFKFTPASKFFILFMLVWSGFLSLAIQRFLSMQESVLEVSVERD